MSDIDLIASRIREAASREAQILQAMVHASAAYEGTVDQLDDDLIGGWVWDANRPSTPLEVSIFCGNDLLVTVPADVLREDLRAGGKGDGRHSFSLKTPAALKEAALKEAALKETGACWVAVRVAGTDFNLDGSPRKIPTRATEQMNAADDIGKRVAGWNKSAWPPKSIPGDAGPGDKR